MNNAGLLRLMVSDPLAMNMSNTLGYLREELKDARKKTKNISFDNSSFQHALTKRDILRLLSRILQLFAQISQCIGHIHRQRVRDHQAQ